MANTADIPEPICITVEAAATLLSLSRASVWRMIRSGRLPARRLQGRTLIETATVRAVIASAPTYATAA